jgi:hypothetical protein
MPARIYYALAIFRERALHLFDIVFVGFFLGILDRSTLHRVDDEVYRRRRSYHSDEHNLRGLFPWEEEAIARHFQGCRRLLLIGAGGGREVIHLGKEGREVHGFECNAALVDVANRLVAREGFEQPVTVAWLARDVLPDLPGGFDGLILGWSAYMFVIGRQQRIDLLRGLRALGTDRAPVLLSFFTRSPDYRRYHRIARVANAIRSVLRRPPVEPGDDLAPNFVHRFTSDEVQAELAEAGFEMVEFHEQGSGSSDSGWAVGRVTTMDVPVSDTSPA